MKLGRVSLGAGCGATGQQVVATPGGSWAFDRNRAGHNDLQVWAPALAHRGHRVGCIYWVSVHLPNRRLPEGVGVRIACS
jgi:hypothetical protein